MMEEHAILQECLAVVASGDGCAPLEQYRKMIDAVASSGNGAAVTIIITFLLKKCADLRQDLRRYRASIPGGYSGRELDAGTVTSFLESNGFSAAARSGWSDRSFDVKTPYDF